jgi:uncharacterized membrane protein
MTTYDERARQLSRGLGWFSLGTGVAQLLAPRAVARLSGVDDSAQARMMMPMVGLRELASAGGLLSGQRPARWMWTRVGGDAMDLMSLGVAWRNRTGPWRRAGQRHRAGQQHRPGQRRRRTASTTAVIACVTAIDVYAALRAARAERSPEAQIGPREPLHLNASVTVRKPRTEVFLFWHLFDNLPTFMSHLESVQMTGDGRSHWKAKSPIGKPVEWDAEIVVEVPDELITWRSLEGSNVPNSGTVRFSDAPGGRGTEVRVEIEFDIPGGKAGAAIARLFGEHPEQQVRDDLRRFKQVVETGAVVRSEGSPEGTYTRRQMRQRPAQPVGAQ